MHYFYICLYIYLHSCVLVLTLLLFIYFSYCFSLTPSSSICCFVFWKTYIDCTIVTTNERKQYRYAFMVMMMMMFDIIFVTHSITFLQTHAHINQNQRVPYCNYEVAAKTNKYIRICCLNDLKM